MAFTPLTSSELQPAKAVKSELFTTIKADLDDHETRISAVETNAGKIEIFSYTILNGLSSSTLTGIDYFIANADFNLLDAKVIMFEKGSATGTLEIDVKLNTTSGFDPADYATVFSTKPSLVMSGASDYDESTNAAFSTTAVSQGDYLRLDITSLPTGGVFNKFRVHIYGEVS